MGGTLYIVGTPIGNLEDLSPRAARIFSEVDFIAAEDTRVTLKLLSHLGIHKPLVSYYEHNRAASGEKILSRLLGGESCALVTDAGMPAISDPGEDLVRLCAENGVTVTAAPGPSALVTAMAVSGMPSGRFCFEGFLSRAPRSRREHLESLKNEERTMIFYEAPHKLLYTLRDMYACWGNRRLALCRELTKLHEELVRTDLEHAVEKYSLEEPRGEFVLVIEGAAGEPREDAGEDAVAFARQLAREGLSLKDAAKQASERFRTPRNGVYAALLAEKRAAEE